MRERNVLHDEINNMEFALFLNDMNRYEGKNICNYKQNIGNYVENGLQSISNMLSKHELFENKEFKYLYFGNEFCEYKIPTIDQLKKFLEISKMEELIPVFVTPVVTDFGIRRISECLNYLNSYEGKISIVVNDFGVMQLLKKGRNNFEIIAGRILDKLSHESRASYEELYEYYGEEGIKYATIPGILSEKHMKILDNYNVGRYEFDLPKVGIVAINKNTKLSLYWPYSYETTGRVCVFRSFDKIANDKFSVGDACKMNCINTIIERITTSSITNTKYYLFQMGNTMFYVNEKIDLNQISNTFDRIIVQVF